MTSSRSKSIEHIRIFDIAGRHARAVVRRYSMWTIAVITGIECGALLTAAMLGIRSPITLVVQLVAIALMVIVSRHIDPIIDRWLQGARGEEKVARIIASLKREGWRALHDIDLGRGNIDHILLGPAGLFTIETKSHRGRIKTAGLDKNMLRQAYAAAKSVERITGLKVVPLLVFSDAYLTPAVSKRNGVTVLPARMLPSFLQRHDGSIPVTRVEATYVKLAHALAFGSNN